MFMEWSEANFSTKIQELLEELRASEELMEKNGRKFNSRGMPHQYRPSGSYSVIPGEAKGPCQDTLLVLISPNKLKERLAQAALHVKVDCPKTKHVIFWGTGWNSNAWSSMREYFLGVECILKDTGTNSGSRLK